MLKKAIFFVIGCMLAVNTPIIAAEDDAVYVVAKRINDASQNRIDLDRSYIEQAAVQNGGELLSDIPGVDVDTRNKFGRPTSVSMMGFAARQVRVMVDGIPFNNQLSGQVNTSILPVENINSIEIVKGPTSSVYGSALGGSINFLTKQPVANRAVAGSIAGIISEHHQKKTYGEVSGKVNGFGYYLSGSYMDSTGDVRQDDSLENKLFVKTSLDVTDMSTVVLSWGLLKTDANTGVLPDGTYERYPQYTRYGKLMYNLGVSDNMTVDASLKFNNQDITTQTFWTVDDLVPAREVKSTDKYKGFDLKLARSNVRGEDSFVVGSDLARNNVESIYLTETKTVDTIALYGNYTIKLETIDIVPALRYDNNSEFKDQISPSLGIAYKLPESKYFTENVVTCNVARSFNAAPLLWKYYDLGLSFLDSNSDLKPERAMVYQLSLSTKIKDTVDADLDLFYSKVKDAIAAAQNANGDYYMKNFERFINKGVSLALSCSLGDQWKVGGSSAFVDVKNDITNEVVKGQGARIHHDISVQYDDKKGTRGLLIGNYNWWNQSDFYNSDDRKFVWDLKLSKDLFAKEYSKLRVGINIYNLTNTYYAIDEYYPHPGRYFEGVIKLFW